MSELQLVAQEQASWPKTNILSRQELFVCTCAAAQWSLGS
jgi:hypothetical protein